MGVAERHYQRWSLNFVSDRFTDGRRFRILAIVDDFTRESLALIPDTLLSGGQMAHELNALEVGAQVKPRASEIPPSADVVHR